MNRYAGLARLALAVSIVLGAVAIASLAHASLSLYTAQNVTYIAHWTWNDYDADTSNVQVLLKAAPEKKNPPKKAPPPQVCLLRFKVIVAARADDGTTVENYEVVQIPANAVRKVQIPFDRTLTSLDFIKILALPGGSGCDV